MKVAKVSLLLLLCGCLLLATGCRQTKEEKKYFECIRIAHSLSFDTQDGDQIELYGSMSNIKHNLCAWHEAGELVPFEDSFEEEWLFRLVFNFESKDAVTHENGTRIEVLVGESLLQIGDQTYQTQGELSHSELLEWLDMQYTWQSENGY